MGWWLVFQYPPRGNERPTQNHHLEPTVEGGGLFSGLHLHRITPTAGRIADGVDAGGGWDDTKGTSVYDTHGFRSLPDGVTEVRGSGRR